MFVRRLTTTNLRRELARRKKGAVKLQKRHSRLAKALAAMERNLLEMGLGAMHVGEEHSRRSCPSRPGRPKGSKNKPVGWADRRGQRTRKPWALSRRSSRACVRDGQCPPPRPAPRRRR